MDYYGNLNSKRLQVIQTYDVKEVTDPTTTIGFIKSKGLFLDYVLKQHVEGYALFSRYGKIHPCDNPKPFVVFTDTWNQMKEIKRSKATYYVGEFYWNGKCYGAFMELPRISNDEVFTWKTNRKYGTLETTIKKENFEYLCIVKADGNALVEVKYTKQENKHRNNVTLERINVYNASNQDILDAIKKWQGEMISYLKAV